MLFDTAKHLYDLATMLEQEKIQNLLAAPDELKAMLAYKRREERERIGSDLAEKPFSDFSLFQAVGIDTELTAAFIRMQEIYVFSPKDLLSPERLTVSMKGLNETLIKLDEELALSQTASEGIEQQML